MMAFEGGREEIAQTMLMNGARVGSGRGAFGFTDEEWALHRRGSSFCDHATRESDLLA